MIFFFKLLFRMESMNGERDRKTIEIIVRIWQSHFVFKF